MDVNVGADPLGDIFQFQGHDDAQRFVSDAWPVSRRLEASRSAPCGAPRDAARELLVLGPALDQLVIGDGLALGLLVVELGPGRVIGLLSHFEGSFSGFSRGPQPW